MADEYISREVVVKGLRMAHDYDGANYVMAIPAADVVPVRHGRWIWNPDGMDWGLGAWCCSECKSKAETWWANDKKYNPLRCSGGHFCGNCGALMDKDGDGE